MLKPHRMMPTEAIDESIESVEAWEFQVEEPMETEYTTTVYGTVPSRAWLEYREAVGW